MARHQGDAVTHERSELTRCVRTKILDDECRCVPGCDCWVWEGALDDHGYARFKLRGKTLLVHRYVYQHYFGDLDPDLTIDHLCDRHRNCVNPAHFEQVTLSENSIRANARRWGT